MNVLKLYLSLAIATSVLCVADEGQWDGGGYRTESESRARDFEALQEFINTKRAITVKEKSVNLMISGNIRSEWFYMSAKNNGKDQRGWKSRKLYPNSYSNDNVPPVTAKQFRKMTFNRKVSYRTGRDTVIPPFGKSEFDVRTNLVFDYVSDRSWGTIRVQMINPAGVAMIDRRSMINDDRRGLWGSGRYNEISLRKCFAGYNFWSHGTSRFDMEIGRRRMYDVFDSKIGFYSVFDGILARYTSSYDGIADVFFKAGAFVIDSTTNHYGYVSEFGLLNLGDSGMNFKYSILDWDTHDRPNRYGLAHAPGNKFVDSQFLLSYNVSPDLISQKTTVYGAYWVNTAAKATSWTYHKKANDAFYVGARVGQAVRKGDYSIELYYQWVQAQAIPENDVAIYEVGLSRDNPRNISFYNRRSGGTANVKGWRLEGFYALTDNWTLNVRLDDVSQFDRRIGGTHKSKELYLSAIYTF